MSFDGNGNYTVPAGTTAVTGTVIDSADYNALLADLQTALTKALLRDGQSAALANLPMGGYKLTGLAAGSSANDSVRFAQLPTLASLGGAAAGANTDITSLNGPALGAATATTPATTDSDTSVATTAFVKAVGFRHNSIIAYSATGAIAASDVGKMSYMQATGDTVWTLPALSGLANGDTLHLSNLGSGDTTVTGNGTDKIYAANKSNVASLVLRAGQSLILVNNAGSNWIGGAGKDGSLPLIQSAQATRTTVGSGTTIIPADDTIPQITEGDEYLTISFTPESAASALEIDVIGTASSSIANVIAMALFKDADADALAVAWATSSAGNYGQQLVLHHTMVLGSITPVTFRVRIGGSNAGTTTVNGAGVARLYGGKNALRISVKELLV